MALIFISHSSKDRDQANDIKRWLDTKGLGTSAFLDFDVQSGLPPGSDWERRLYQELESAEAVLIILTPNWLDSKWCFAEFTQARALGKAIFPVIATPVGGKLIAPDIQHLDLLSDREGGLERLSGQLTRIVLDAQGGFPWDKRRPPYPGLLSFEEEDAAIFFGRDDDIRRVIERLNARRAHGGRKVLVILGGSGSGKSSLLRAGIIPRLKRDQRNWIVLPPVRPQSKPLQELAISLAMALGEKDTWRSLAEQLAAPQGAAALLDVARDLRIRMNARDACILLPIDQGEELFTNADADEASRFLTLVSAMVGESNPFIAVFTLRSEFLAQLQFNRYLTARFEEFSLKPMPLARIADIIEGPARVAGIKVEKQLTMQVIQDATSADALPLIAFTLRELYDRFGANGDLTYADYMALGDVEFRESGGGKAGLNPFENSIRKKADEVIAEVAPSEEELGALRDAFSPFLVRVNDNGEYTRRTAELGTLPPAAAKLIEALVRGRLLVSRDDVGKRTVEVAHDALLRKWPLLKSWLDNERELIVGLQRIQPDIDDYAKAPPAEKAAMLLSGPKLELMRLWHAERPQKLNPVQKGFIEASIAHVDALKQAELDRLHREQEQVARTRRFQTWLGYALGGIAVLVLAGSAASAFLARRAAERESQLFAAKAFDAFEAGNCDRAMRYAVAGLPQGGAFAIWSREAASELRKTALDCRLMARLEGHTADLNYASFSPDGLRVLTTSADGTAGIFDRVTGKRLLSLEGHADTVYHGDFDPGQRLIVTASADQKAIVWDATTGAKRATLEGHTKTVWSAFFDRQGQRIVTASDDGTAAIWQAADGKLLHKLEGHGDRVALAIFNTAGTIVATGAYDNDARLWNAATGKEIAVLKGHTGAVRAAGFGAGDRILVTTSNDGRVRTWDARTGTALKVLEGHADAVMKVAIDPFSPRAATGSQDATVIIWNIETGERLAQLRGHTGEITDVAFLADDRVVSASKDQTIRIWDARSGEVLAMMSGHEAGIESIAISQGQRMIVTASHDKTARVWDASAGRSGRVIGDKVSASEALALDADGRKAVTGHDDGTAHVWLLDEGKGGAVLSTQAGNIGAVAITRDGKVAAAGIDDGSIRIFDTDSGKELGKLQGHDKAVRHVQFTADGRGLLSTSPDRRAIFWDVASGKPRFTFSEHTDEVYGADISSDQSLAVTASHDKRAIVWSLTSGQRVAILEGHTDKLWKARFSPDGARVVTISDDMTGRIFEARSGKSVSVLRGHEQALGSVEFSSDGRLVVTSSDDNTARVWEVDSGRQRFLLRGHRSSTLTVKFSSDGQRVLTTSRDGTARVWSAEDGGMLLVLRGHRDSVGVAAFRKGDRAVVTASQDGTVRFWNVDTGVLTGTAALRTAVCTQPIPGTREFSSSEASDPVIGAAAVDRVPCARTGSFDLSRLWR